MAFLKPSTWLFIERNVLIFALTGLFAKIFTTSYGQFLPLYFTRLGAASSQLGIIFSAFALITGVASLIAGYLVNLYSKRTLIVLGGLVYVISMMPLFFVRGMGVYLVALLLLTLSVFGGLIYQPAFRVLVSESTEPSKRATAFSVALTLSSIGAFLAPTVGGFIWEKYGSETLFLMAAAAMSLVTLGRWVFLKIPEGAKKERKGGGLSEFAGKMKSIWRESPNCRGYMISSIVLGCAFGLVGPYLVLYLRLFVKLSYLQIGAIFSANVLASLMTAVPGGKLSDVLGRQLLLVIRYASFPITTIGTILSTSFVGAMAFQAAAGAMRGLVTGASTAIETEIVKAEDRGTAAGIFAFFSSISGAIGLWSASMVILFIPFTENPRLIFYMSIVGVAAGTVLFQLLVRETVRRGTRRCAACGKGLPPRTTDCPMGCGIKVMGFDYQKVSRLNRILRRTRDVEIHLHC